MHYWLLLPFVWGLLPVTNEEISRAIAQLGAAKHAVREQASDVLWTAGDAAVPALEAATRHRDPEIAQRARQILANLQLGIRPDTPPAVRELLRRYHETREMEPKQVVVAELVALGEAGRPALAAIAAAEPNQERRMQIFLPLLEPYGETVESFFHDENPSPEQVADVIQATQYLTIIFPEEVSVPTRVIPKLDRLGKKKEADELFERAFAAQQKLVSKKVEEADAQNNLAWLCAVARRRLDDGLTHAQKAVALAPKAAAYLDTLAEIHFQKGDRAKAGELAQKCIELDPDTEYFKLQKERFRTGRPSDPPPEPENMVH